MFRSTTTTPSNKRVFGACLLSFAILITPIAALAAPRGGARPIIKENSVPPTRTESSATDVFVNPPSIPAPPPAVVNITATMVDSIENDDADGKIDVLGSPPNTEKIVYTATISNSVGSTDATALKFSAPLDSHTTTVAGSLNVSPLALDDSYETIGNTLLEVGVVPSPSSSPKILVTDPTKDTVFDNDTEFLADSFTLSKLQATTYVSGTVTATSVNSGSVTMDGSGHFSYLPAANFTGTDTFTYTIKDSQNLENTATVTINVTQKVWYVKNNQAAGGLGRSTDPFDTLLEAQTASAAGDTIYVFNGNNTTSNQSLGITLKANQRFVGEGVQLDVPVSVNGGPNPTVLRAAGTAPQVTNTGGNDVTVTNISGVSIRGFNFVNGGASNTNAIAATFSTAGGGVTISNNTIAGGTANAIDVTTTTTTPGGCTATITNNTITGAGGEGIDINGQGSGGITLDLQSNAVTATGNGIDISGVGGGTLNISAFANNSVSGASGANGIIINTARFDSVPGGGVDAITAGTTTIGSAGAGNGVGGNGLVLINTTGTLPFSDLDIWADGGNALDVTGLGVATTGITVGAGVGTINATNGTAVKVSGATIDLQLTSISSNNATTGGVSLTSAVNGTFSAGASSTITNATGDDFIVGSGTANITYNGPISSSNGNSIDVSGHTGGTIAFTGSVADTGGGISLTSNGGTIINFSGGITLNGTAAVFTATGGGTVTATGTNTIGTPTAATTTALNVASTTIGASGLTFRSISSTGAASGIILNGTGAGFLTVTGNGGSCSTAATCTGGAIQNSTQDAVKLTSANNISLTDMFLFSSAQSNVDATTVNGLSLVRIYSDLTTAAGILGSSLTNLTITNGTYDRGGAGSVPCNVNGVEITNLLGTSTVTGALFKRSNTIQFHVVNNTATSFGGTPDQLTVSNTNWNTHTNACAGDHLSVGSDTGGNFRLTVNNSIGGNVFKSSGIAVQATAFGTNGKMDALISNITSGGNTAGAGNADTNTAGVVLGQTGTGTLTFNVHNNTTLGTGSVGIKLTHASGGGTSSGRIENNSITHIAGPGTDAMGLDLQGVGAVGGTSTVVVKNNTITGNYQRGIKVQCGQGDPDFNVTLDDNHLTGTDTTGNALQQIDVEAGLSGAGSASTMRLNMLNNDVVVGPGAIYTASYRLINRAGNTFQLQDFVGNGALTTDVANWVTNAPKSNTTGGGIVSVTATAAFSASAGPIPTASLLVPRFEQPYGPKNPNQQEFTAYAGDALRSIAQASIAGESDTSNMSASLAKRLGDVVSLVGRFANSAESLMVPTAYAEERTEVSGQKSEAGSPRSEVRLNHAKSRRTLTAKAAPASASLAPMFSGETVTFDNGGPGITLPAGKSITITFKATLNDPPNLINTPYPTGGPQVGTQGTVSGSNFSNVLTDDPAPPAGFPSGASDPTRTAVDLYNTSTTVTTNKPGPDWVLEGEAVTFTATVASIQAGSPVTPPTGKVQFLDNVTPITCSESGDSTPTLSGGVATCTTTALTAGAHTINANYQGDGNFDTSGGSVAQTVNACTLNPVVTTAGDTGAGSLRDAIGKACVNSTITFTAAAPFNVPATIPLATELSVTRNLTIDGPDAAANHVTVSGNSVTRAFMIQSGKTVTIRDLTISGGQASPGAAVYNNHGTLTLLNMTISGNTASGNGGGVFNDGLTSGAATLTIINSTLSGNTANAGGAISNNADGTGTATMDVINSTISGNNALDLAGGIVNTGNPTSAVLTLTNVTITNNHSDFDDNGSGDGGGILAFAGIIRLRNTIVAGNFKGSGTGTPNDISGNVDSTVASSNNLIGTGGAGGLSNGVNSNQVGVANPGLGPLADNGGPTQTHNLLFGSPAIEGGNNTFSDAVTLTTDQRGTGFIRKADSADANTTKTVDIGAIEAQATIQDITDKSTPEDTPLGFSFDVGDDGQITSVTATSSNTGLVSNANAVISGSGSTRTLTLTPTANQSGTSTITVTVNSGTQSMQDTFVLTVTAVGDQPTITSATTPEDTQTTSGLVITKSVNDGAEIAFFKITNITNGTLFQNDGTTTIINNQVITEAEGNAGLKFTPAANLFSPGTTFSFQAQGATDGLGNGTGTAGTGTITVNPVADTPSVTDATTNEDTQTVSGLVISRNAADSTEVTHFKITGITGGSLFQNNGTTAINNNDFITFAQGNAGLRFTPSPNLYSPVTPFFGFTIQASTSNVDGGLNGNLVNATVTVNPVADTPSVTNATTSLNTQTTSGLVISRNLADSTEVTHFKITNIVNGSLFQNNGTTPIAPGSFITFAEGNAGLKFTPTAGLTSPANNFSFDIRASVSNVDGGLGGGTITATITVNPSFLALVNTLGDAADVNVGNGVCDTDSGTVGDQCTLRAAIQEANFASTDDTINFDPLLNGQIIMLDGTNGALPAISGAVNINGPGANLLTVQRTGGAFRIFNVTSAGTVTISGLTIKDGLQTVVGSPNDSGGGILVNSGGTLNIVGCTLTGNTALSGGALNNLSNGTLNVINSTLSGNSANAGAAISNGGSGVVNVTNSTINGNTATSGAGGGISNAGGASTNVTNSTISSNTSTTGGAGINISAGTVTLKNTIVAYNTTNSVPSDINGAVNADYSLIANNTGATITGANNAANVDPLLGALANNGGPTQTRSLGAGSPALDGGNNVFVATPPFLSPFTDQRGTGFARILDAGDANTTQTVDMGAFEARAAVEDITDKSTPEDTPLAFVFNVGDSSLITSVTATSANTTLVPNANAVISGSGSTRTLTLTPVASLSGTSLITVTVTSGSESMTDTFTLTVSAVGDTPSVTNATTTEDTQTTSGLVISRNVADGAEVTHFKITGITNGSLFQNDGTTPINNGDFITFAQGNAGLKFTPTANSFAAGSFTVQAGTDNSGSGLSSGSATATITVTTIADTPSVTNATTDEDVQTISGLVISRNVADGAEVTHFKITGITNGSLFQANGTTPINDGDFITFAQGNAGLKFTPAANSFAAGSFTVQASTDGIGTGLSSGSATATITVNAIADTPSVTNATTNEDAQTTSGLVISRNAADGAEVTHFKITGITNGSLFQNDGTTAINNGDFITFAQGNAGLKFTPTANSFAAGSFTIQASTSGVDAGLGGSTVNATITVNAIADTPSVTNATTDEDVQTVSGLVISRNAADGAEVTHFKITGITNGSLFQADGTTPINNGDFITFAQGNAGLKFTPATNSFAAGSFQVQASTDAIGTGLSSGFATATITVNAIADTPSVTNATTSVNVQTSSGLVISRNVADGAEVTHFKITNIVNGTLFQNDGTTPINTGDFITFAEGSAGLKFTPGAGLTSPGSTFTFDIQASTSNANGGLGGSIITATITVNPSLTMVVNTLGDAPDVGGLNGVCDTDSGTVGDQCTLRAALQETNNAPSADFINFSLPANSTIVLTSLLPDINGGDLVMTGPSGGVTVSGNNLYRVFKVVAGNVSILNLTMANGQAGQGGGIFNTGNLTITNGTLVGNKAVGSEGGAIYSNSGTLLIVNSTISGNTSDGVGGGLANAGTSTATLSNVTITNNRADADGNASGNGGGISQTSSNGIALKNTIVAGNFVGLSPGTVADDINGTVSALSNNNLVGTGGSGGLTNGVNNNQVGVVDARLGLLASNGGPTQTHALLSGSVALDAGDDSVTGVPLNLTTDQRGTGFPRQADGPDADTVDTVDIGAFEADPSVEDISDKSTSEDTALAPFIFNVGDSSTAFTSITATSSNTTLVPNANIVVGADTASTRTLSITPAANEFGTTTITVTVTKGTQSMSDTFLLTVNGVNDPPSFVKGPDQTVAEDSGAQSVPNWATAISQGLGNESGQTLTFLVQNNTNPGLFSAGPAISPTGTLTYTPAANANGTATITIALMDNGGGTDTSPSQQFVITVTEVNDFPSGFDDALSSVAEDSGQRTIPIASLLANDTRGPANENGQTLTLTGVSNPVGGTVTRDATNVYFTPAADYNGPASFLYTLTDNGTTNGVADPATASAGATFTITEVNDAPTAVGETIPNVTEDAGGSIPFATLTANDVKGPANESGQTLIVKTVGNPVGGTVSIVAGNVVFTPTANYSGPGSFDYTVEDNGTTNGAADPRTSGVATASFTITTVNDPPTAVNDVLTSSAEDSAPRAIPFADLTGNDLTGPANESGQTLVVIIANNAVGGSVVVVPGFVVFTLTANYNGPASFNYVVQDNGTTNGVADPKTSGPALVQFNITEVNDAPTAVNDTLGDVAEDSGERMITFADLTANDLKGPADESGQSLTITAVSNPIGVTVSIVAGTVRITPLPDFNGAASFQYTIRDNGTTSGFADEKFSTATVSFNITAQGDAPSVTNATTSANTQTTSGLVISRNPADGPEVTHFKITAITGGTLFKNDGTTPINNGDFITFAEGNAGLKFTPGTSNGSFTVQASLSASDAGVQGGTATAIITVNSVGGVLRFSSGFYNVAEGAGSTTITVERTGDASQPATVDYASSDHSNPADFIPCNSPGAGFASSRCDFTTAIGTLRFAAGETSKTFNVLISNDNYVEGPETLELALSNPTGGAVFGVPQTATLTIIDDATEPATNPIDTSSEFVRAQYHDMLNREPDAPGLAFWTDNIEKCNDPARRPADQTAAQCIDKQRESTAVAFFMSPEFNITGGFVYHLYKGSLTGAPNYDGGSPGSSLGRFPTSLEFMRDVSTVSEGIVVNNQISGAVVEANRNRLAAEFVLRPEFVAKYGGLNNTLFVDELFNTTGITATAAEKQALVDGLTGGTETKASVLRKVVDGTVVISEGNVQFTTTYGQAFINQENRRMFVFMEYVGYLRRNPDTAGYVFWLGKLNFYNGDPFQAEMVRAFILSPEYRQRFGQ